MDPAKVKLVDDAINNGGEMTYRSLIQDALSEGNEAVTDWLLNKVKTAHEGSFKDIIEEAVKNANTESETYKPTDLAKKYWNKYFPEAEQQNLNPDFPLPSVMNNPEVNSILGEWEKLPEDAERLRGSDNHFGEQQAEGLDNLLEGLRDTPHDNRW